MNPNVRGRWLASMAVSQVVACGDSATPPASVRHDSPPPSSPNLPQKEPAAEITPDVVPLACHDHMELPAGTFRGATRYKTSDRSEGESGTMTLSFRGNSIAGEFCNSGACGSTLEIWRFTGPGEATVTNGQGVTTGTCSCPATAYDCVFDVPAGDMRFTVVRRLEIAEAAVAIHETARLGASEQTLVARLARLVRQ